MVLDDDSVFDDESILAVLGVVVSGSFDFTSAGEGGSTTCSSKELGFVVEVVSGVTSATPEVGVSDVVSISV